jgi:predicted esterase
MANEHAKSVPIFWGHGTEDPLVKYSFGVESSKFLREMGVTGLMMKSYPVGHSASDEELSELVEWIKLKVSIVGE